MLVGSLKPHLSQFDSYVHLLIAVGTQSSDLNPNSYWDFSFTSYLALTQSLPVMAKKVSQSQVT